MSKTTISVGQAPLIIIESVGEDVRIRGHELDEIIISTNDDESVDYSFQVSDHYERSTSDSGETEEAKNDAVDAKADNHDKEHSNSEEKAPSEENIVKIGPIAGDGMLDVPSGASLRIGNIGGDAQLRSVHGAIEIGSIGEDLSATKTGALAVESVGADASLKRVSGDVTIKNIGGDASCHEMEGDINIAVGEDLSLTAIQGNLNAKVGEDTILRFPLIAGRQYSVIAGGDISCYLPDDTNAEVMLRSGTRTLRVRGWEVPAPPEDELYTFTLGKGGASLNLNAGEDIALVNQENSSEPEFDFDFDFDFGPGFKFRFDSESGFRPEQFSNLFSEKIQAKVQNAMRQAEESIANAISHAESRIANAEQRASNFEAKWTGRGPRSPKSRHGNPAEDRRRRRDSARRARRQRDVRAQNVHQEKAAITEEERLMVLRMVEEGKISVEQAEKLLSAMGS